MAQNTTIVLLRHGRTEWNVQGKLQGQCDSPLLPEACGEARAIGARLRSWASKVTRVYTSPLPRASRTAELVCEGMGTSFVPEPREGLKERSFGIWEGKTWAQVEAETPEQHAAFKGGDREWCIPGGESSAGAERRFIAALTDIAEAHPGEVVVVVTHSNCMSQFMHAVLQLRVGAEKRFSLHNDAMNAVAWRADKRHFEVELWGDRGQFAAPASNKPGVLERGALVALGVALGALAARRWN